MLTIGAGFPDRQARVSQRHAKVVAYLFLVALFAGASTIAYASDTSGNNIRHALNLFSTLHLSNTLPGGKVDESYNAVLSVGGGKAPYHFSVASGSVPPGLSLNPATGSISGKPTVAGVYTFSVMVTDVPYAEHGSQTYIMKIDGENDPNKGSIKITVSPSSANLTSGARQQFTATVTATSNSAVTWSATAGSITHDGLYTAPSVTTTTSATITATSVMNPAISANASVTIAPGSGTGTTLQITTAGLPQGQQGVPYSAALAASGGSLPYSWTIAGGNLPPGTALNTDGSLAGTPSSTGTFNFSVTVTDAASHTATAALGTTIITSSGYDGPAQLPVITVSVAMADSPAPGNVTSVSSGGDLQSALNNAHCGDTLQLQAGATFTGKYTVPAKGCDVNHWIIIRTSSPDSALPVEGQRLTPCYAGVASLEGRPSYSCSNPKNVLAKVQMQLADNGPFLLASGANFYRFVGLEITRPNGVAGSAALISLLGTADHIIVDRSWLHGNAQDETSIGFATSGGTYIGVVDSYFNDFHCIAKTGSCTDAHGISGGTGETQDGPYLIQNNFLEASGEAVMFGGGHATLTPTDITIIGNHFWKPWQWMKGNPNFVGGPDGNPFIVKNHMELKNAVRVLADSNLLENSWGGFSQTGFAIVLSPKNQHTDHGDVCPICEVTDVTVRYSHIAHAGGGIIMATSISGNGGDGGPAKAGTRWSIHDLVLDDISTSYVGYGALFTLANGWPTNPLNTVTINHITGFPDATGGGMLVIGNQESNQQMYGFVFTNSIVTTGRYPVWNTGGGKTSCGYYDVPITSIGRCFSSYTFNYNALVAAPSHFPPPSWPSGNFFTADPSSVGFVQYNNGNGGNYQLQSTSPYINASSDGRNLGADIAGLESALAGVE